MPTDEQKPDMTGPTQIMDVQPPNDQSAPIIPPAETDSQTPAPDSGTASVNTESTAETSAETSQASDVPEIAKTGKGAPVGVIVTAVIVALGLVGVTVYAYLKTQDQAKPSGDTPSSQQEQPGVTAQDVDQTSQDIDSAASSIDDTADFAEGDLSDQTLGL